MNFVMKDRWRYNMCEWHARYLGPLISGKRGSGSSGAIYRQGSNLTPLFGVQQLMPISRRSVVWTSLHHYIIQIYSAYNMIMWCPQSPVGRSLRNRSKTWRNPSSRLQTLGGWQVLTISSGNTILTIVFPELIVIGCLNQSWYKAVVGIRLLVCWYKAVVAGFCLYF